MSTQTRKPLLSLPRFRGLKGNPFAIFDKDTNVVYHTAATEDAYMLIKLLNQFNDSVNEQRREREGWKEQNK